VLVPLDFGQWTRFARKTSWAISNTFNPWALARRALNDNGVEYLACFHALEDLDLDGCSNIGSIALGKVLGHLTNLTTLTCCTSYYSGILKVQHTNSYFC
jgi:hypothetical protein